MTDNDHMTRPLPKRVCARSCVRRATCLPGYLLALPCTTSTTSVYRNDCQSLPTERLHVYMSTNCLTANCMSTVTHYVGLPLHQRSGAITVSTACHACGLSRLRPWLSHICACSLPCVWCSGAPCCNHELGWLRAVVGSLCVPCETFTVISV